MRHALRQCARHCWAAVALAVLLACNTDLHATESVIDTVFYRTVWDYGFTGGTTIDGCAVGGTEPRMFMFRRPYIYQLDMETGAIIDSMPGGPSGQLYSFLTNREATILVASEIVGGNYLIHVWRWPEKERVRVITESSHGHQPRLALSSDGRKVFNAASGSCFDTETGERLWQSAAGNQVKALPRFTRDDKLIIMSLSGPGSTVTPHHVGIIDAENGVDIEHYYGGPGGETVSGYGISEDGRYIGIVREGYPDNPGSIWIWDRINEVKVMDTAIHIGYVNSISFVPDNSGFFVDDTDNETGMYFYRMGSWERVARFEYFTMFLSPDWRYSYYGGGIAVWLSRLNLTPLGIQDDATGQVSIFPQPAGDLLQVSVLTIPDGPLTASVTDTEGRLVLDQATECSSGVVTLSVTTLAAGSYVLRLTRHGQALASFSFIKGGR